MSVKIISEIGINHNGDMKIVKKLIDISSEAGCDAVKFQKELLMQFIQKRYLTQKEIVLGVSHKENKKKV